MNFIAIIYVTACDFLRNMTQTFNGDYEDYDNFTTY